MIIGAILNQVRDHLRSELDLSPEQIEVRFAGVPPAAAASPYVCLRELGVECDGRTFLREQHQVEVALWRRLTDLPDDVAATALYGHDPLHPAAETLDTLERAIIRSLHGNYTAIMQALNQTLELGSGDAGDRFQLPLYYTGRKATETLGGKSPGWVGRRLHFAGLTRVQPLHVMK